jgi:hydrogenase maturation protein HypF
VTAATVKAGVEAGVRHRLRVRGVVQGVGFRPFAVRLASELGVAGHVGNDTDGVFAEVEGSPWAVAAFERRLVADAPPLARVDALVTEVIEPLGELGYSIVESRIAPGARTYVAPDAAVCDDCVRELFDPVDRRYRHPFITCTNCGPRFSITRQLPYDRPNTTMAGFEMCDRCAVEYHDPGDRRYHAQPVACPACGPSLWFESRRRSTRGSDAAIVAAQRALAAGRIVAVKGIGGFHLACDATSEAAVAELRRRKGRAHKPFAVMVRDLAAAARVAVVDEREAALLSGPQHPIVLLARVPSSPVAEGVAPANPMLGVVLPYSGVHHLLFAAVPGADVAPPEVLVMTSGNLSDEPICFEDDDARRRLATIVDDWLLHDRPIQVPCDDSVARVIDGEELPIRRSRGYAPMPVRLPFTVDPVLAVGGELKNTFCLAVGRDAWLSQHIGDMGSVDTLTAFERSTEQFAAMYSVPVGGVGADAHPGYHTRLWAEARPGGSVTLVQHHHAHIAAAMVEHGVGPGQQVIGVAFDGTGYGPDGAIWGGEVLVADYDGFERAAHLRYTPLPGGDSAIRHPARVALAHLWASDIAWSADLAPVQATSDAERTALARLLERGVQSVPTSSMGRLFDAVSSLLDIRHTVTYEGQAALEQEHLAAAHTGPASDYRFGVGGDLIDPGPVLVAIIEDLRRGIPVGAIAAGFHVAVARAIADVAGTVRARTGLATVALTGGVFQNALLVRLARAQLRAAGFEVLTHRLVPPNDAGLALGQVAVAGRRAPSDPTSNERES